MLLESNRNTDNIHAGCTFVVVPCGSHTPQRIFVNINNASSKTVLMTVDANLHAATAIVTFREPVRQDLINATSGCHIDGLAVYRGSNDIIDVCHDGFNITNDGIIQVNSVS